MIQSAAKVDNFIYLFIICVVIINLVVQWKSSLRKRLVIYLIFTLSQFRNRKITER
jgi:hypothetical protein